MLKKIKEADEMLIEMVGKIHKPFLNKVMLAMTFLGDGGKVWFLLIALFFYVQRSVIVCVSQFVSLSLAFILAEIIIKRIVCRVRPCHKIDEKMLILKKMPQFYSFPSSHSATSFAMLTATCILGNAWVSVIAFVIACGVAFSRFYLQAHYLTDVICGILIGILCGVIGVVVVQQIAYAINTAYVQ